MMENPNADPLRSRDSAARGRNPKSLKLATHVPGIVSISDFGLRISAFLRPSDFGFRIWLLVFVSFVPSLFADTNSPDSSLLPPRGEIPPGFWELYAGWIIVGSVFAIILLAAVVWFAMRPKPAVPVSWSVQTRQQLQILRQQPPDSIILSGICQILRRQIAAAFGLPCGETTTCEFHRALSTSSGVGPELSKEIVEYLAECDRRKFAPSPPPLVPWDPFAAALKLVEKTEMRLAELQLEAASKGDSGSQQMEGRPASAPAAASKSSGGF
jgi:hypothetical protein